MESVCAAPYTTQQNPVAEVGNRTTVEKPRVILKHTGIPAEFGGGEVTTAVYLENWTPIAAHQFKSLYELWHGSALSYDHLKVFGCLAYVHIGKSRRAGKFFNTAIQGVFLRDPS